MNRTKLQKVIESAKKSGRYCKQTMVRSYKNVCVYGLGKLFEDTFENRKLGELFHVNFLADSNTEKLVGRQRDGIKYVTLEELRDIDDLIIILLLRDTKELEEKFLAWSIPFVTGFELLLEMSFAKIITPEQFKKNEILEVFDLLEDSAKEIYVELMANRLAPELAEKSYKDLYTPCDYFNQVFFPITQQESFVDCGAYDGDTIRELLKHTDGFEAIYSFELDRNNFRKLSEYVATLPKNLSENIELHHAGVLDEYKEVCYGNETQSDRDAFSILKTSNKETAVVEKLDDVLNQKRVTLIKMDIEGSELQALHGAENIIREQHPKLAICLYHKIEDFWEIPMYLHKLVPEYHFGILHHVPNIFYGTVLYAWCE